MGNMILNISPEQIETLYCQVERMKSEAKVQRRIADNTAKDAATQAANYPLAAAEQINKAARYAHAAEVLEQIIAGL
jgi:hypothetical protein